MGEPIWVAELRISRRVAEKLIRKHGVHPDELRLGLVCAPGLVARWVDDPEQGRRALVRVLVDGRRFSAVLYPVPHPMSDIWHLGTAYPERRWT